MVRHWSDKARRSLIKELAKRIGDAFAGGVAVSVTYAAVFGAVAASLSMFGQTMFYGALTRLLSQVGSTPTLNCQNLKPLCGNLLTLNNMMDHLHFKTCGNKVIGKMKKS